MSVEDITKRHITDVLTEDMQNLVETYGINEISSGYARGAAIASSQHRNFSDVLTESLHRDPSGNDGYRFAMTLGFIATRGREPTHE